MAVEALFGAVSGPMWAKRSPESQCRKFDVDSVVK